MRTGSIYIIRNNMNNKVYIGQTTMTVRERFMTHMKPSTSKRKSSYKLYNAINKYGRENFYYETLEENIDLDEIDEKEILYIDLYDSYINGYNSTPGGDGRIINKINNEKEILKMAEDGMSTLEIAKIVDTHQATVIRTLHKLGFYYIKEIDPNKLKTMVKSGLDNKEIAEYFGVDKATISRHLKKHGLSKRREIIDKRKSFDLTGFIKDFVEGIEPKILISKYNLSNTSIYRLAKKHNLNKLRSEKKEEQSKELSKSIYEDSKKGIKIGELVEKYGISDKAIYYRISEFKKTCRD